MSEDASVSGKKLYRPGLSNALSHLTPGSVLVVDAPDRLARDLLVALTIRKQVEELGCTIEYADGSPSGDEPETILMQNIMAAFASYERSKYARRTKAGMARKKAEGVWCGRPPYGWRVDSQTKQLAEEAIEQLVIRTIADDASFGFNSEQIAGRLNLSRTDCRGKQWSARTIRRILARNKKQELDRADGTPYTTIKEGQ
jgi:DNA invertase Pin-like site-specific DNA recombinase